MLQHNLTPQYLFPLLRSAVYAEPLPDGFAPEEADWQQIISFAGFHHLTHLVEYAAQKNGLRTDGAEKDRAVMQYLRRDLATEQIRAVLNAAGIPFILLKGAVLQGYYPEAWMRTSSDVDVLVRREDLDAAEAALCAQAGFRRGVVAAHDIQLISPANASLELHHILILPELFPAAAAELDRVWDTAVPVKEDGYEYRMEDSLFFLYHIAHMMKHFRNGGCGIRFFLDLRLIEQQPGHDAAACKALAERCGMLPFTEAAERLAEAWFGCGSASGLETMEQYVLSGGIYGTTRNAVAVQKEENGSGGYLLQRLFPPMSGMKYEHPILRKQPWLLPFFWVKRLFRLCRGSVRKRVLREYKTSRTIKDEHVDTVSAMMKQLGMDLLT